MLLSPRKNGLTSLFKEVRVFKVQAVPPGGGGGEDVPNCEAASEEEIGMT